jgi:hypothetical protein
MGFVASGKSATGGVHPFVASDAARFLGLPSPASVRVDWSGLVALGHVEFAGATNMTLGTGDEKLLFARTSDAACTILGAGTGRQSLYAQVELHQDLEVDWQGSEPLTLQRAVPAPGA